MASHVAPSWRAPEGGEVLLLVELRAEAGDGVEDVDGGVSA